MMDGIGQSSVLWRAWLDHVHHEVNDDLYVFGTHSVFL